MHVEVCSDECICQFVQCKYSGPNSRWLQEAPGYDNANDNSYGKSVILYRMKVYFNVQHSKAVAKVLLSGVLSLKRTGIIHLALMSP